MGILQARRVGGTPWSVACQDAFSMGILQARRLGGTPWSVACQDAFSRGILQARMPYSIIYTKDPKAAIRKLLELINESGKIAYYKVKTEKFVAFLYTTNERSERETQETIPFTITTKRLK